MSDEGSGLKELFDNKAAELKNKTLYDYDYPYATALPTMDSTFLGPILWEDTLPISDLDNIKLEDFAPEVLERSTVVSNSTEQTFLQNSGELDDVFTIKAESCPRVNIDWSCNQTKPQSAVQFPVSGNDRPQPPRKKSSVPVEQRNEKYWSRRMKNNASAKRSRDARRMMENQVHMKATLLERENEQLKLEVLSLTEENKRLRELLNQANIHTSAAVGAYPTRLPLPTEPGVDTFTYQSFLTKTRLNASPLPNQDTLFFPPRPATAFGAASLRPVYDAY